MSTLSDLQEARLREVEKALEKINEVIPQMISRTTMSRLDLLLQQQYKDLLERVENVEKLITRLLNQP